MTPYVACGFWPDRGEFIASVVDTEGRLHYRPFAPQDDLDYWGYLDDLERQHGLDIQLVLPEPLLRGHPLAVIARARRMTLLTAPTTLAVAIADVAYARTNPRRLATVLARLPGSRFQGHLRLLPRRDPKQMLLL
jgi:hypothetical protein